MTPSGGTPNYTYAAVISGATAPTVFASGNIVTIDTNSAANLVWDVYVKDANGCTARNTITIIRDALPTVTAVINNQCAGSGSGFTITATGADGVSPYTYSINGTSFQNSTVFNVSPGTYTVTVKDANGCTATAGAPLTVYPQLTAIASVTKELDCTTTPPNATITTTISGGKANYSYVVTNSGGTTVASATGIAGPTITYTTTNVDTYTFTITDANGCVTTTSATVVALTPLTVTASQINVSCNGTPDGSVTLTGAGGSGGYTYSDDDVTYTLASSFTGLGAGIHTFYVKDSKGCVGSVSVTITEPTTLDATATATAFSCSATNTKQSAVVTIAIPTTGTSPYEYSFNGGGYGAARTLTVNDNGTDQVITYSVRDAKGCIDGGSVTLLKLNPPAIATITNTPIYCTPASSTTSTVTVPVTASTGVAPLAYTIVSGPVTNTTGATTGAFSGLTAGTYVFRVTDANGCYATKSHTVLPVTPIAVTATKLTDVDCFGNTTGSARFTVTGFSSTGNYAITVSSTPASLPYTLSPTGDVRTLTGLVAGTYTFSVTDTTTGCPASAQVTITQPAAALAATYTAVNANCNVATARVEVAVTGGTPNYRYSFVTDATTPGAYGNSPIANLNPTTSTSWYAHVIDAKGCTFILPITIVKDATPTVTASAIGQCLGTGSYTITANGTGGTGTLTYSINGGASYQSGTTFVVTTAGTYTIKVKDANGCTADSLPVVVAPQLTLTAVLTKDITCVVGDEPARITVTPSGGSGLFTYAITTPASQASNVTGATSGVFTTSVPGNYTFTVTDTVTGCTYTTTTDIVVTPTVIPEFTVAPGATINCNGDSTASINVTIDTTKGQAPFIVNVQNTTLSINYGTQTSGLRAGNYTVTVTDARGCFDIRNITITEPAIMVIDKTVTPITCDPGSLTISKGSIVINKITDGVSTVGGTGGTAPYTYYVTGINGYNESETNSGTTSVKFDVVDFGLYQIRVVDANGCTIIENDVEVASNPNDLDINVNTSVDCTLLGTAEVKVAGTLVSSGPFHFNIYIGPGQVFTGDGNDGWQGENPAGSKGTTFTGLIPGVTYTFIVYDEITKCYYFETATPTPTNSQLKLIDIVENNIKCSDDISGSVSFKVENPYLTPVDVTYQIFEAFTNTPISPVSTIETIAPSGTLTVTDFGAPNLVVGTYYILVKEVAGPNSGCSIVSADFNIQKSPNLLLVVASKVKNINCNEDGVIAASASNGTGPYTYQYLLDTVTAPDATTAGWVTNTTFATSIAGDYVVYVKDAYGCIKSANVSLVADALPTITVPGPICYNGTEFTIDLVTDASATATITPATYSVNGSAFQSSPTFMFNAADTYRLFIKDGNGCEAFVDYVVRPQLQLSPSLDKALDCNLPTPNAAVKVEALGGAGAGSYTYTITAGPVTNTTGATTGIFTGLDAGNYTFEVNDGTTCTATTTFTIDPLVPIVPTATVSIPLCVGDNANVEINATGGTGNYEFKKGFAGVYSSSNIFTQTALDGTVTYYVKDTNNCEVPVDATVVDPTALGVPTIAVTQLTCGTGNIPNVATITVTASGGTGAYEYSFDNGVSYSSSNSIATAIAGTYEIIVKDANGCETAMQSIVIASLDPPTNMDIAGTPIYCVPQGLGDVTSTVTISNPQYGVAPFTYQIISPIAAMIDNGTNPVFAGLTPDTYVFQITDANGCTYQESYTVAPVTNITVAGQLVSNVTCNPGSNGAVRFTVANFSGTYSYTINGTSVAGTHTNPTIDLTGLAVGIQTIVVTDVVTGCTATAAITVGQPAASLSLVIDQNIPANCNFGARVSVIAAGGTPNYKYAFVQNGVTPTAFDYTNSASAVLNPAFTDYDVYVMDANGCTTQIDVTISTDDPPTIDPSTGLYCYTGTPVPITITGTYVGIPMYSIGNGYQSSANFVLNAPGNYTFYIKDGNGCIVSTPYELKQQLLLQADMMQDLTCATNASITLLATQGTDPYVTYEVKFNGGAYTTLTAPVSPYTATAAGTYRFRVTDSQGCQAESQDVIVTPTTTPSQSYAPFNVSCVGGNDGSIIVTAANGIAPYQYILNGGTPQASNVFTGLIAGSYTVQVMDSKSCLSAPTTVDITEPIALAATGVLTQGLTCGTGNATQAAIVTINVTAGGTAPYQYSFNGGLNYSSTNTYSTYSSGTVTAYVKDANGCVIAAPINVPIPALNKPTDLAFVSTAVTCLAPTSTVTLTATNGVASLQYEILSPITVGKQASATFAGLAPGTYLFQVTDANGCAYSESYTVNPVTNITVAGQLVSNVTCNPGSNGAVQFTVSNFASTYSYSINGAPAMTGQTNPVINISGLNAASVQTIVIRDEATGCPATTSVTVAQAAPLSLVQATNINANCNFGARVSVTASGGVAPYEYSFVVSGSLPGAYSTSNSTVLDPATATAWDVYVRDVNGCVITTPLTITIANDPLPTGVTTTVPSQCPSASGTYDFTVNVLSGVGPFQYSIGSGFQTSPTFTVNVAGTYDVIVKDANGCTTTVAAGVVILPALNLQAIVTALPSCSLNNGIINATATGGSAAANYRYSMDGSFEVNDPATFTNVGPGVHTIQVRDVATGCTDSVTVDLVPATPITGLALDPTNVSCRGGSDGLIIVNLDPSAVGVNDNPIYTYTLTGTTINGTAVNVGPQQPNVFSNLEAGDYTVTVTSGRGCVDSEDITITQPALIVVNAPVVSPFGCTSGTNATNYATITVNSVTGGSGNYVVYEFVKGAVIVQRGASNVYTEADLLGGSYTVNVYDDKGCIGSSTAPITIAPFIRMDDIVVTVNNSVTCIGNEDITVSVTSTGGTPALLNYTVTGISGTVYNDSNTSGVFTGLTIGNYLISVVNPLTGCIIEEVHYVNNPNTFDLTIDSIFDVTCFSGTDGSANVTLIDRIISATDADQAGPFTYNVVDASGNPIASGTSTNAGPITISTLAAGTYTITATLTNTPYCTVSKNFTITAPAIELAIAETHTEITCVAGNNDGTITASATGGWSNVYEFELVGPVSFAYSAQANFTGLTAGNYTVNVRDSKGCIATTTVNLSNPTPIVFTAAPSATLLSCFGDRTASITASLPTGGQGSNYMYTLNTTSVVPVIANGPQASPTFSGLGAGTYTVTVTDGYSCSATSLPITIAEPAEVIASLVKAATQTCLTQASLTLSATGGTGIYTYSTDPNFVTSSGTFTNSVTFQVPVGTYHYYVKDANGCVSVVSNDIEIPPLETLILNVDATNAVINCKGDLTGVIVATAQGGLGNYVYTLLDGAGLPIVPAPTQLTPGDFTGLAAGFYKVKVDSGDCNTTTVSALEIKEPLTPISETHSVVNVTCFGEGNGQITITATGGTGIIKYAISPRMDQFFESGAFTNLEPGLYDLLAQDENGCYIYLTGIAIIEPTPLTGSLTAGSLLPEICFGDNDGAFSVDINGGTMPYSVSLDDINGTYTTGVVGQTQFDFTGLAGGAHTVYVKDFNGCVYELIVDMPESVKIDPVATVDYGCVNNSASNSVTVTVDASITNPADVDYSLDGAPYQLSNVFTNIAPGTGHYIDVRHTNGCIQRTLTFDIAQIDPLAVILNDGGLNEIVATTTGGSGNYQYTFNGESTGTKNTYIFYKSGDYTVEVTDSNGCTATATRYFEFIDIKIPNVFTPNGDGNNDGWTPTNTINYPDLVFHVFDRYGRKVGTFGEGQFWDGKYNGTELPTGDYWYVLKLKNDKDAREFVGHFTLYR